MSVSHAVPASAEAVLQHARSHSWRMLVDGELREAQDGSRYPTGSPSLDEHLTSVPAAGPADVDAAVQAAARAGDAWRNRSIHERVEAVRRMAEILLENEDELAMLDALNGGNPLTAMRGDIRLGAEFIRINANLALELKGQTIPGGPDHVHYTVQEPFGVVARIVPYNHPAMFTAAKSAAPLIAGNTVVLKCPDQTPLSSLRIAELFADIFPPGVLNIISGHGPVAGDALVRHPLVRRIAFIGSVPTGLAIQRAASADSVKNVSLELGGKNPLIVYPDADIDAAVEGAVRGMNFHWSAGQSCGSTSRVLLHESIADRFVPAMIERMERVAIGDPLHEDTEMGTLVSQAQYDKVMSYIELGQSEGAEVLTGGGRPAGGAFEQGRYVTPTMLSGVKNSMRVAQEEIFGPVVSVLTWSDPSEAIQLANDITYGLTASIWTRDLVTAHRAARDVQAGFVWINDSSRHFAGVPFGGYKNSGVGREEGINELFEFTQLKSINVNLAS